LVLSVEGERLSGAWSVWEFAARNFMHVVDERLLVGDYCASSIGDSLKIARLDPVHLMAIIGKEVLPLEQGIGLPCGDPGGDLLYSCFVRGVNTQPHHLREEWVGLTLYD
jgi:hypothetical protein